MAALDQGLRELQQTLGDDWEQSNETHLLLGMKEALIPRLPRSERADLKERLAAAIENENYELAAILRDEIRLLRD
jgi:protein-arginine kinase activator protein McsA